MKAGILGGGQLGRMLLQAAINYPVETFVMESDTTCPSAYLCHNFVQGDIRSFDDVFNFGKDLDLITIEIESVNVDALEQLENTGVKVIPNSAAIRTIQNKIVQKKFYTDHQIPTSKYIVTYKLEELSSQSSFLPAVHKAAEGGYDGRGVQIFNKEADFDKGFNEPAVLEKLVNIKQEIAVILGVDQKGEIAIYPSTEMVFDHRLNLLDFQISPARLAQKVLWKAEAVALKVVKDLRSPGVFAVELFVDNNDDVWVNETAPRVHNSGHHTIEANFCSQFDMLWRILLGYPLGNTKPILSSALVNILGAENNTGPATYKGLNEVLKLDNVFVHIYGKQQTKPGRKMGHVTILSNERQELIHQAMKIKNLLQVVAE